MDIEATFYEYLYRCYDARDRQLALSLLLATSSGYTVETLNLDTSMSDLGRRMAEERKPVVAVYLYTGDVLQGISIEGDAALIDEHSNVEHLPRVSIGIDTRQANTGVREFMQAYTLQRELLFMLAEWKAFQDAPWYRRIFR